MEDSNKVFHSLWENHLRSRESNRIDAEKDRAFWKGYAKHYDERIDSDGENVSLEYVKKLIEPTDSILEIGAGTGRFTIPLAEKVEKITALDHSPEMLGILGNKVTKSGISNIALRDGEWPNLDVASHDVVLAAWSLYRSENLTLVLKKCIESARRGLVIILGAGDSPPHRQHIEEIFGRWGESTIPGHLYIAGLLWEMGYLADVNVLSAKRRISGDTPEGVAAKLAPLKASRSDIDKLVTVLGPEIKKGDSSWEYIFEYGVAVVSYFK